MKKIIDIRSDTKTRPTQAMYQAMLKAELGDEQNNEDPSVLKLQEMSAKILGKKRPVCLFPVVPWAIWLL